MILDPFGGVSLGALDAMRLGLHWRGVELEAKFVELGNWNISNWNAKFSRMPHWCGDAVLLQGDSRKLLAVLGGQLMTGTVSSPPYAESVNSGQSGIDWEKAGRGERSKESESRQGVQGAAGHEMRYGSTDGQLDAMKGDGFDAAVSSPPFVDQLSSHDNFIAPHDSTRLMDTDKNAYGYSDGQLGTMNGDGFDAAISSPPYCQTVTDHKGQTDALKGGKFTSGGDSFLYNYSYGETDGQLGAMKGDGFDAAISSPPYTGNIQVEKNSKSFDRTKQYEVYRASGGGQSFEAFCATQVLHSQGYGNSDGQLGAMKGDGFDAAISSPPFQGSQQVDNRTKPSTAMSNTWEKRFGEITDGVSDGNLANMSNGDFQAAISSPPFRQSEGGTPEPKPGGVIDERLTARHLAGNSAGKAYGDTEGQLANMGEGDFEGLVSSPPFERVEGRHSSDKFKDPEESARARSEGLRTGQVKGHYASEEAILRSMQKANEQVYGNTEGNMGNDSGDDFWLAARQIVEQVYLALKPGGHAVWVCKDFVKNKTRVPFSDQWRQLCEAVGFVTLHEHHALLVRNQGKTHTLEGNLKDISNASKSFFRRLAEKLAAENNYWENGRLTEEEKEAYIKVAHDTQWKIYNSLTDAEREEKTKDGLGFKHPSPTTKKILKEAKQRAMADDGHPEDWNSGTRIDHETIWCMVKK